MVNPGGIKALALDLDGTILAAGAVLNERTVRAVKKCMRRGIRIIIATGRSIEAAEPYALALGAEGPMICFNGALVVDMPGGGILSASLLGREAAEFCVDIAREMGLYCQVFFPGPGDDFRMTFMAERDSPEREMYHEHTGLLAELGDLKEALSRPGFRGCFKCMFLSEPEVQAALRLRLKEHFGGSVYIVQTMRTFLEVMDTRASKGLGLKTAMEKLSLKSGEIIAFGDEENDLPMFSIAGFSAAPSSAKDAVKAQADLVIGSNDDDGVAAFLEEFFGL